MAKMQFFYLGKAFNSKKPQGSTFKAHKRKDKESGETRYYPLEADDQTEVFIPGTGWKKAGKSVVDIPVFDGDHEHWEGYLEKYGDLCLYHSLDGTSYLSNDCASINRQTEYNSIRRYGAEGYVKFMEKFMELNEIQLKALEGKYLPALETHSSKAVEYTFKPCYYMEYTFIPWIYSVDPVSDDKRMSKLYKEWRTSTLENESADYQAYLSAEEERKRMYADAAASGVCVDDGAHEAIVQKCLDLYNKAMKPINEQVEMELTTDNGAFPTSPKGRIAFLFGDRACELYSSLVDDQINDN